MYCTTDILVRGATRRKIQQPLLLQQRHWHSSFRPKNFDSKAIVSLKKRPLQNLSQPLPSLRPNYHHLPPQRPQTIATTTRTALSTPRYVSSLPLSSLSSTIATSSSFILVPYLVVGGYLVFLGQNRWKINKMATTECEAPTNGAMVQQEQEQQLDSPSSLLLLDMTIKKKQSFLYQMYRAWRMFWRCCKLAVTLAPIAALYPIYWWNASSRQQLAMDMDAQDIVLLSSGSDQFDLLPWPVQWYLQLCLQCVEASGAAVIKLMQWAGSRPDIFGSEFCAIFCRLQDHTTPHAWRYTERALQRAFGKDWKSQIDLNPDAILGSGCIGQVYIGMTKTNENNNSDDAIASAEANPVTPKAVAIKVLHPYVQESIEADLDLMRTIVGILDKLPFSFLESLQWLNLPGAVEEFATILTGQLDLRAEAQNLQRFRANFEKEPHIIFPKPLTEQFPPTRDVLVETYHPGIPVMQFAREHQHDRKLLSDMCFKAIRCVCKMIFLDNFIHGDLHPGNVFVSPDGKDFILLDVGIVSEYSEADHQVIVDILSSFIRRDGRKAASCMIADSNRRRGQHALDEQLFIDKIDAMARHAADKENKLMEHLGSYITQIYNAAATHHILMNQSFVSAALAVKVQEGIALALDPQLEMWRVATPIIVESERRRHGLIQSAAKHVLGRTAGARGGAFAASTTHATNTGDWAGELHRKATMGKTRSTKQV